MSVLTRTRLTLSPRSIFGIIRPLRDALTPSAGFATDRACDGFPKIGSMMMSPGKDAGSTKTLRLPAMGRALAHRNFRLFVVGQGISVVGTWMQQIATVWLVYRLSNSSFLLGAGRLLRTDPRGLGPAAGGRPDRPLEPASHRAGHPDAGDGPGLRAHGPDAHGGHQRLAGHPAWASCWAWSMPSTRPPGRALSSRWSSGTRTSPTPSPSTRRYSTPPGSWARPSPGW